MLNDVVLVICEVHAVYVDPKVLPIHALFSKTDSQSLQQCCITLYCDFYLLTLHFYTYIFPT